MNFLQKLWNHLSWSTLITFLICAILIAVVFVFTRSSKAFPLLTQATPTTPAATQPPPTEVPPTPLPISPASLSLSSLLDGIRRDTVPHTSLPTRPRFAITQYTVVSGDSITGIASKFNLKPSTILFANYGVLFDDPENLKPGQVLKILPVDGVYYQWHDKDSLTKVAKFYGVTPDAIIDFLGNHLNDNMDKNVSQITVQAGTWLIVPGGYRSFISASAPTITRSNPAVASQMGPGFCGKVVGGAIGTGSFVWPTTEHWVSGYDYNPDANHPAIDIAGQLGNPVYASDSGVVVYAGWNNTGYGNLTIIDHGNGWQTLYAHQSAIDVGCGESVTRGVQIGSVGATGNATGPHLHFEMSYEGSRVNPHSYLPPP
ncbi:MAG: M23 family metallopeptidase [Anaerolineaceae bacterium]|nr:M23 family metallopeptidase [Anaerolineaceae bacterium]